jgi:hypothetical protein
LQDIVQQNPNEVPLMAMRKMIRKDPRVDLMGGSVSDGSDPAFIIYLCLLPLNFRLAAGCSIAAPASLHPAKSHSNL